MIGLFVGVARSGGSSWSEGYACGRLDVMPLVPLRLADDRTPPTLLFTPPGDHAALPLILFGHGAHLSKDDPIMQMIAKGFSRGVPAAVALMDCPGHGERRAAGITDAQFNDDVARRMSDPDNCAQLTADWRAVEEAARAADRAHHRCDRLRRVLDGRDVRARDRRRPPRGRCRGLRARRPHGQSGARRA